MSSIEASIDGAFKHGFSSKISITIDVHTASTNSWEYIPTMKKFLREINSSRISIKSILRQWTIFPAKETFALNCSDFICFNALLHALIGLKSDIAPAENCLRNVYFAEKQKLIQPHSGDGVKLGQIDSIYKFKRLQYLTERCMGRFQAHCKGPFGLYVGGRFSLQMERRLQYKSPNQSAMQ